MKKKILVSWSSGYHERAIPYVVFSDPFLPRYESESNARRQFGTWKK
jgi:hypothetical protein